MLRKFNTKFNIFKWYDKLKAPGVKTAWMSAFAPVELFLAFDIIPVFPENHAAMIGALTISKENNHPLSEPAIAAARASGLSFKGLCSYVLSDVGAAIHDENSPIHGLPFPFMLYSCNSQCTIVDKWAKMHQGMFQKEGKAVPVFILDTPHLRNKDTHSPEEKQYWMRQLKEHIAAFETLTAQKFDIDRVREIMKITNESNELWLDCLNLCRQSPAPFTSFDAFGLMAPIVIARGSEECLTYYRDLKNEITARVAEKYSPVGSEKIRLIWDAIPIWPKKNFLNRLFADWSTSFVASTYTNCWDFNHDLKDPMESFYRVYGHNFTNHSGEWQFKFTRHLFDDFRAQGIVIHWNESCAIWNSSIKKREELLKGAGIPYTIIHADMTDSSFFDEGKITQQLQSFVTGLK